MCQAAPSLRRLAPPWAGPQQVHHRTATYTARRSSDEPTLTTGRSVAAGVAAARGAEPPLGWRPAPRWRRLKPSTYRCFCRLPAATTHASSSHLGPSICTHGGEAVHTVHTSAVTLNQAVPGAPGGLGCLQLCLPLPIRACRCISAPVRTSSDMRRKLERVSAGWRQRPGGTSDSRQAAAGPAHPRATAAAAWRACCPGAPAAAPRARTSAPPPPASRLHHQRFLVLQQLLHEHGRRPTTQPATVVAAAKLAGACDGAPASRDFGMSGCSTACWAGGAGHLCGPWAAAPLRGRRAAWRCALVPLGWGADPGPVQQPGCASGMGLSASGHNNA